MSGEHMRNIHCDTCHELNFHGDVPIEECQSTWCLLTRKARPEEQLLNSIVT
jgi:hypothetical protein